MTTTHPDLDRLTAGLPEAAAALAQRAERLLSAVAGNSPSGHGSPSPGVGNAVALLGSGENATAGGEVPPCERHLPATSSPAIGGRGESRSSA